MDIAIGSPPSRPPPTSAIGPTFALAELAGRKWSRCSIVLPPATRAQLVAQLLKNCRTVPSGAR